VDPATQKLLSKSITAEVSYRLRTGQDLSLAEISKLVQNRHRPFDDGENVRVAFRKAAEEALRRKSRSST
jgi:hypothetical protein